MHCFIVVWHWGDGCEKGKKIVDKQYSLAGNPKVYEQGSTWPETYVDDTKEWNDGDPIHQARDILPPDGMTESEFDAAVIRAAEDYTATAPYEPKFGPNSNTATHQIIKNAGRILPNIPGAYGQYYGSP